MEVIIHTVGLTTTTHTFTLSSNAATLTNIDTSHCLMLTILSLYSLLSVFTAIFQVILG